MDKAPHVSVIIPCYNEEGNLEECVRRLPFTDLDLEVIIVNDGSRDRTREVARRIIRDYRNVKLIDFLHNRGKTEAIKEALRISCAEIIVIQDADLSVAPEYIRVFYNRFINEPGSFFTGTRFIYRMGKNSMPSRNALSNKFTARIFSVILKQKITDALCGTKMFGRDLRDYIEFDNCRWPDFDLLLAAGKKGLAIKEVPVEYLARKYGKSSMRLYPDAWGLAKALFKALCRKR